MKKTAFALLFIAGLCLISSCGTKPEELVVSIADNLLGSYNASPVFNWSVQSTSEIEQAWYRFTDDEVWNSVLTDSGSFMITDRLVPGDYNLQFMVKSGVYTEIAETSFSVVKITSYTPDDPYYTEGYQWNMDMLNMADLWGLIQALLDNGSLTSLSDVVVAVIDTGYTAHPDLIGHIDTENDYDFYSVYEETDDGDAADDGDDTGDGYGNSWHGTSVAGTIAAETGNGIGVAGLNLPSPNDTITILPLRALGTIGGYTYDIAEAVYYAAGAESAGGPAADEPRAKIINMSLGGSSFDAYMDIALKAAVAAGCIPVAASGNESDSGQWIAASYPASSEYAICVASVDEDTEISYFSNISMDVDIAAPGGTGGPANGLVLPTVDPDVSPPLDSSDYAYTDPDDPLWSDYYHTTGIQGTSFSCPHTAGILALLCSIDPEIDFSGAKEILEQSLIDISDAETGLYNVPGLLNGILVFEAYLGGKIYTDISRELASFDSSLSRLARTSGEAAAEAAADCLIVKLSSDRFSPEIDNEVLAFSMGAKSAIGSSRMTRLMYKEDAESLEDFKNRLKLDSRVEAVYYNYKYYIR